MEDFQGNASEAGQTLSELGASKGGKAEVMVDGLLQWFEAMLKQS